MEADKQARELATLGPLRAAFERLEQDNVQKVEELVRLKIDNEERKQNEQCAIEAKDDLLKELEEAIEI